MFALNYGFEFNYNSLLYLKNPFENILCLKYISSILYFIFCAKNTLIEHKLSIIYIVHVGIDKKYILYTVYFSIFFRSILVVFSLRLE